MLDSDDTFHKSILKIVLELERVRELAEAENDEEHTDKFDALKAKLLNVMKRHLTETGNERWLKSFEWCWACEYTTPSPLDALGTIVCKHIKCQFHKEYREMFNEVYTEKDIKRMQEHIHYLRKGGKITLREADVLTEDEVLRRIKARVREKECREFMYG